MSLDQNIYYSYRKKLTHKLVNAYAVNALATHLAVSVTQLAHSSYMIVVLTGTTQINEQNLLILRAFALTFGLSKFFL